MEDEARIYVGDYASYNNGFLFGRWLSLNGKTTNEIWKEIRGVLKENSAKLGALCEEPMFQDFEGFPREFYRESNLDFERLAQYLELEDHEQEKVRAYLEYDPCPDSALERFEDVIIWDSFQDYMNELPIWEEIPVHYHHLIDADRLERELRIEGNFVDLPDRRLAEILL